MTYRTLLIPLDGSDLWELAVETSLPLAQALGSRVVLFSVFDWAPDRFNMFDDSPVPGQFRDELRSHYDRVLRRASERFKTAGIPTTTSSTEGDPVSLIIQKAEDENADMIVMASKGRTGVPRFLLGSVADGVLRQSHCPVLIVHPPE